MNIKSVAISLQGYNHHIVALYLNGKQPWMRVFGEDQKPKVIVVTILTSFILLLYDGLMVSEICIYTQERSLVISLSLASIEFLKYPETKCGRRTLRQPLKMEGSPGTKISSYHGVVKRNSCFERKSIQWYLPDTGLIVYVMLQTWLYITTDGLNWLPVLTVRQRLSVCRPRLARTCTRTPWKERCTSIPTTQPRSTRCSGSVTEHLNDDSF